MSAFPACAAGQIQYERLKVAMRVAKDHYHMEGIARRHFLELAKECRFSQAEMDTIVDETLAASDPAIAKVRAAVPSGFPPGVSEPVFAWMAKHAERLRAHT
jgi:serine/threonine-protein kinase HipA